MIIIFSLLFISCKQNIEINNQTTSVGIAISNDTESRYINVINDIKASAKINDYDCLFEFFDASVNGQKIAIDNLVALKRLIALEDECK